MVVGPGVISNSRTFGRSFGVSQMLFFWGIESSAGFPNITPRTKGTGKSTGKKTNLHVKRFVLSLAFIMRFTVTRKWPIEILLTVMTMIGSWL